MDENPKSKDYLMVNPEDYLNPRGARRKRFSRSVSPVVTNFVAFDDGSDSLHGFRISSSTKSLHLLDKHSSSDSSANSSFKLHKSSEHLCVGKAKKKLHRRAHVSEVYRRSRCNIDPGLKPEERTLMVPVLTATMSPAPVKRRRHISGGSSSSALSSLIEQTLKVTTASMGLKAGSEERLSQNSSKPLNGDVKRRFSRSTSSVSTLAYATPDTSMAPLQSHTEAQSVTCLNTLEKDTNPTQHQQQQKPQHKRHYCQQLSTSGSTQSGYSSANSVNESNQNSANLGNSKAETRSLKHNSNSLNPLVPVASSASIRSASSNSSSHTTAKHEQSSAAAAAAASTSTTPQEKEKKRKEVSSSRVKKFHRHFSQVSKDEKLINYFSCALVSDILLQGHLYITDQHFAFYSNVFGYVTKVVIPTSSVTKISKEKTAKIIPNAVGVATVDERHVFGSFISREAAFRLMCSVCPPLAPADILPKAPADIEISEEYSIEDDSSCSISGNESPPQTAEGGGGAAGTAKPGDTSQNLLRRPMAGSSLSIPEGKVVGNDKLRFSDIPSNAKSATASTQHTNVGVRASAPPATFYNNNSKSSPPPPIQGLPINKAIHLSLLTTPTTGAAASAASNLTMIIAGTASSTSASSSPTPSSSSSPTTVVGGKPKSAVQAATDSFRTLSKNALLRLKFPTELHVVYMGVMLAVILALFSVFLLYRILDIEAKTSLYRPVEFNWRSGDDEDIFAEALRWQKELQTKSTEEAQSILNTNLEQIAKVRRSLETLSLLIHDRSSAYATTNRDDSD